jgi:hypothetical protein
MSTPQDPDHDAWLEIVRQKVETLRFGCVQLTVHDGKVTVVESTERTRIATDLPPPPAKPPRRDSKA